jgi:hypothetical protein
MDVFDQLAELNDYEEIQQLNANHLAFISVVHQALEMEDSGQADSDDVDATIAQAIEDNAEAALDVFDLEIEVEFEDVNSAGANFGEALSVILEDEYENPGDGIEDIAEITGVTPEEVQAYMMGKAAPSPDVCRMIADHYLSDDPNAHQQFCMLGMEAYEAAMADNGMGEYSAMDTADVQMSAELSDLRAEFSAIQTEREVGSRLRELEKIADGLQDRMILTPAERNSLLRSAEFSKDQDSVAAFSQFCFGNGVNPHTYLDNVEFCLNWKAQTGPSGFSAYFSQETDEPIDLAQAETQESQSFLAEYRSRHSYQ